MSVAVSNNCSVSVYQLEYYVQTASAWLDSRITLANDTIISSSLASGGLLNKYTIIKNEAKPLRSLQSAFQVKLQGTVCSQDISNIQTALKTAWAQLLPGK